jgi:metabolite-proton symporter
MAAFDPGKAQARRVLAASLVGTTIEFFDFYIYATAAVLVFPKLFFPAGDPAVAALQSLATFALAFLARPLGAVAFGHFGDRMGRKATLVAALLTMGISTVCIGILPSYAQIGVFAPIGLALCRLGQGVGLGGEWGGAVLLAVENAPPGKRAWYGMFPQLGAPIGFVCSSGVFLLLSHWTSEEQFVNWAWRIPFLCSALLVAVGLYVRLKLVETPEFARALEQQERVRVPLAVVVGQHGRGLLVGTLAGISTFLVFYMMTVFSLGWGTAHLGFARQDFLVLQMAAVGALAIAIPLSALIAQRVGTHRALAIASLVVLANAAVFAPLFGSGGSLGAFLAMAAGFAAMGMTYGPLGTLVADLFPTAVRYTGASLAFNLSGIVGASFAPAIATWLAQHFGLGAVGWYMAAAGVLSLLAALPGSRRRAGRAA